MRGDSLGRYVLLNRLGAGGMGVVWAAYDPELDRRVALKLLHPQPSQDQEASQRLYREAQTMARLTHANVVTVHDVGLEGGQVYVAMEFVAGKTLGEHVRENQAGWRELLELMLQAGAGLCAAHGADMVHRDFKPDNVMVGSDGRVLVMDFGLARAGGEATPLDLDGTGLSRRSSRETVGGIAGTPGYMSPEQFTGEALDSRSDQFSFCVTFWELLFDASPFEGTSPIEKMRAVLHDERAPRPSRGNVPNWLLSALERGLMGKREQRWPTLESLLEELRERESRIRRRRIRTIAAAAVIASVTLGSGVAYDRYARGQQCEKYASQGTELWESRKASGLERIRASPVGFAGDMAALVERRANAFTDGWRETASGVCVAHDIEGTWSDPDYVLAQSCLEKKLDTFAIVLEELESDALPIANAGDLMNALESATPCSDRARLATYQRAPSEDASEVAAIEAQLRRLTISGTIGRIEVSKARETLARAEELEFCPVVAQSRYLLGLHLERQGEFSEGRTELERAYFEALGCSVDETAAASATTLMTLVGIDMGEVAEARQWQQHAEAVLNRLPFVGERAIPLHAHAAHLDFMDGDFDSGLERLEQALTVSVEFYGEGHLETAEILSDESVLLTSAGRHQEALDCIDRATTIIEREHGPSHPELATIYNNRATTLYGMGDLDAATKAARDAVSASERAWGKDSAEHISPLANLAVLMDNNGDAAGAVEVYERVLALLDKEGVTGATLAIILGNISVSYMGLDRLDEADAANAKSIIALEAADIDRKTPSWVQAGSRRGRLASARGNHAEALEAFDEVHGLSVEVMGEHQDMTALMANWAGREALALGRRDEAKRWFETARDEWAEVESNARAPLAALGLGAVEARFGDAHDGVAQIRNAHAALVAAERPSNEIGIADLELAKALWSTEAYDEAEAVARAGIKRLASHTGDVAMKRDLEVWCEEHPVP